MGWECLFVFSIVLKNGLQAESITLWALICVFSLHTRVTSEKSDTSRRPRKEPVKFSWKSFHFRQNFSCEIILVVLMTKLLLIFTFTTMACQVILYRSLALPFCLIVSDCNFNQLTTNRTSKANYHLQTCDIFEKCVKKYSWRWMAPFCIPGIFHCGLICRIRICFFLFIVPSDSPYLWVKDCIFCIISQFEKCFKWLQIQQRFYGPNLCQIISHLTFFKFDL